MLFALRYFCFLMGVLGLDKYNTFEANDIKKSGYDSATAEQTARSHVICHHAGYSTFSACRAVCLQPFALLALGFLLFFFI